MRRSQSIVEGVKVRLCHIVKWDDFDGYGFTVHADKSTGQQFVGKVDENSPSAAAGLLAGDRIIEVNEIGIDGETHEQVVERIKAFAQETKLLVVDSKADEYFKNNNVVIKGSMQGVIIGRTPEKSPASLLEEEEEAARAMEAIRNARNNKEQSNGTTTLNLTMSAKELRAKLAQRKKYDPRSESIDLKDKFDIVRKL
ncbi:hypothetical protein QAD02_006078 [Eretmocerus hayati]|uniref:Uncharacterized protein n=1 Tax=Eretmocerus hayati TaxID=131215 RepID=A0ACC2N0D6_9HYME|nr:hypothetical protein QAD02_006078 [Eretmocerus hayati]